MIVRNVVAVVAVLKPVFAGFYRDQVVFSSVAENVFKGQAISLAIIGKIDS